MGSGRVKYAPEINNRGGGVLLICLMSDSLSVSVGNLPRAYYSIRSKKVSWSDVDASKRSRSFIQVQYQINFLFIFLISRTQSLKNTSCLLAEKNLKFLKKRFIKLKAFSTCLLYTPVAYENQIPVPEQEILKR